MSKLEIQEQYREKIAQAETSFEKSMIKAEMEHQLKMIEQGIDAEADRKASQFQCLGCGS
jgi:hypothetical protein